jgi:hypothetical protein
MRWLESLPAARSEAVTPQSRRPRCCDRLEQRLSIRAGSPRAIAAHPDMIRQKPVRRLYFTAD